MIQQSLSQFQVVMKLFIQMRQMKHQENMLAKYMNLRQMISQLLMVVKRGINHRYEVATNPFVVGSDPIIRRVIESFKILNKVYIGQEKTQVFIHAFDKVNVHDNADVFNKIISLMNGNIDARRTDALKVLVPTYMMTGLEKMGRIGFQGDMNLLKTGFEKELQQVQVISTVVQKHVHMRTKVTI